MKEKETKKCQKCSQEKGGFYSNHLKCTCPKDDFPSEIAIKVADIILNKEPNWSVELERTLKSYGEKMFVRGKEEMALRNKYFGEFEVIDNCTQHKDGLNFEEWKQARNPNNKIK